MSTEICERFAKMKVVKDEAECTPEYVEKLRAFLLENAAAYFGDKNNEAKSFSDFDYFNQTTDREHLCMPDEVMLIDRDWHGIHSYVICRVSKGKEKQRVTDIQPVVRIRELKYGDWKNGYFLLPQL